MSKLNLAELVPEVYKIVERAKHYELETEVIAQMIVNSYNAKPTEVIDRMWGALQDWDIPFQESEDDFDKQLKEEEI